MTLERNVYEAALKYARSIKGQEAEVICAAYLSGMMQLADALAKMDGAQPHPSKLIAAIEKAGWELLGHGSQNPDHTNL